MLSYVVRCTIRDAAVAREWLAWLEATHLDEVLAAGATAAEVVALDPPPAAPLAEAATAHTFEVRYRFASRAAFVAYERDHAPRLRAEGLARFPPERGLAYERTTGEVVVKRPPPDAAPAVAPGSAPAPGAA